MASSTFIPTHECSKIIRHINSQSAIGSRVTELHAPRFQRRRQDHPRSLFLACPKWPRGPRQRIETVDLCLKAFPRSVDHRHAKPHAEHHRPLKLGRAPFERSDVAGRCILSHRSDRRRRRAKRFAIKLRDGLFLAKKHLKDTFPIVLRQSVSVRPPVCVIGADTGLFLHFVHAVAKHPLELGSVSEEFHVGRLCLTGMPALSVKQFPEPLVHLVISL
jgi:hypothetical protein